MLTEIIFSLIKSVNPIFPESSIDNLHREADKSLKEEFDKPDLKGWKKLLHNANNSWELKTLLLILFPFIVAYSHSIKNKILNDNNNTNLEDDLEEQPIDDWELFQQFKRNQRE